MKHVIDESFTMRSTQFENSPAPVLPSSFGDDVLRIVAQQIDWPRQRTPPSRLSLRHSIRVKYYKLTLPQP